MATRKLVELEKLKLFKRKQDEQNNTKFLKVSDKGTNIATLEGGKDTTISNTINSINRCVCS